MVQSSSFLPIYTIDGLNNLCYTKNGKLVFRISLFNKFLFLISDISSVVLIIVLFGPKSELEIWS